MNIKISKDSIIGKFINFLSEYNFGVFMGTMHPYLMGNVFDPIKQNSFYKHRKENILWLYYLKDTFKQYLFFIIIEIIRSFIFNYLIFSRKYFQNICEKIDSFIEKTTYPTQINQFNYNHNLFHESKKDIMPINLLNEDTQDTPLNKEIEENNENEEED